MELVLPTYNVHPYFSQKFGQKSAHYAQQNMVNISHSVLVPKAQGLVLIYSIIFQQTHRCMIENVSSRKSYGVYLKIPLVSNILHICSNK